MNDLPPATYSVAEVALLLQCSHRHVTRLEAAGLMPKSMDLGGRLIRFSRAEVDQWINAGCQQPVRA